MLSWSSRNRTCWTSSDIAHSSMATRRGSHRLVGSCCTRCHWSRSYSGRFGSGGSAFSAACTRGPGSLSSTSSTRRSYCWPSCGSLYLCRLCGVGSSRLLPFPRNREEGRRGRCFARRGVFVDHAHLDDQLLWGGHPRCSAS